MKIPVFHTDLDNTLVYSYKHQNAIHGEKIWVENYQGREITFMTKYSYETLHRLHEQLLIVPTTTRTIEQYERFHFGISFEYVLTCNGGVLLKKGKRVEPWYEESLQMVADCREESEKAIAILQADENRTMEVRWIEELFVFTKSSRPERTMEHLKKMLDTNKVEVMNTGIKVYVVPKLLSKGQGVIRFRKYLMNELKQNSIYNKNFEERFEKEKEREWKLQVIAAGDSEFDVSMLQKAELAFAPSILAGRWKEPNPPIVPKKKEVFSDGLLACVESLVKQSAADSFVLDS